MLVSEHTQYSCCQPIVHKSRSPKSPRAFLIDILYHRYALTHEQVQRARVGARNKIKYSGADLKEALPPPPLPPPLISINFMV